MEKKIVNNYGSFDLTFVKGKNATMYSADGRKYIDFIAGIGVNCLGHNNRHLASFIFQTIIFQIQDLNLQTDCFLQQALPADILEIPAQKQTRQQ